MRAPTPEKLAELNARAAQLGKLKEAPGWTILVEIAEREERKYFDQQLKKLKRGEEVDQQDARAHAIAFDLVRYLLAHPEKAEATLSRAIEKAERLGLIREEVAS